MAANDKQKLDIPWGTLLPLIAALAGIVVQYKPLVSERPLAPGEKSVEVAAKQDVDARLWQDPLAVARKEEEAHDRERKTNNSLQVIDEATVERQRRYAEHHNIGSLAETIADYADKANPDHILLLAVMLDAGPYVEQGESRLRSRQAALQALSEGKFVPVDGEHIGFVIAPWPPETITVSHPQGEGELLLPWEVCKAADKSTARVYPPNTGAVVVVWLPAANFDRFPLNRFASLAESLTQRVPQDQRDLIDIKLIGPLSSTDLQTMIEEVREPDFVPNKTLGRVSIVSPRATMSDEALLYRPRSLLSSLNNVIQSAVQDPHPVPLRDLVKREIEHAGPVGLTFIRTIATDDTVVERLIAELELRGVDVKQPQINDRIAILTEWDSPYARSLAITFLAKASSQSYASVLEDPRGGNWPRSIDWYRYLRGIDGRLPGEERANKESEANQKSQLTSTQPKSEEATEGVDQSDFLRRLARTLKAKDVILQRRGGGYRAIGLLGTDTYDKLMILRALRPEFPDAIFFTNNFDAHFERHVDWRDVHNLVIVSPFGSTLPGNWQPNAAPFRDNLQTSMYAGTLVATGFMPLQQASILATPKIFEVSRRGAYDFDAPKQQTHWFLDWFKTGNRSVWLALTGFLVIGFAFWLKLSVVDTNRMQRISTDKNKTPFGRALRKISDPVLCSTPVWLAFWVPVIVFGVSFFAQRHGPDSEPLAFFSGISIWPTEMLRLIAIVLALHFMVKASFSLKDNEFDIADRFCLGELPKVHVGWQDLFNLIAVRAKLAEIWSGLQRMQKTHADWLKPGAKFSSDDAWFAYLRRNQFWPRFVRVTLLAFVFGSMLWAAVFLMFTKATAVIPVRGLPARNFNSDVGTWLTLVVTVLTFYVVDAIQLNGNFIRLFAAGLTIWPPLVSQRCKRIPPLTEEELSRYHDVRFIAERTEVVAHLIWYPVIVLVLIFLARSALFDNWPWYPAIISVFVIIAMWAVGSAAFLRRAAEQLRDVALRNLELLRAALYADDGANKTLVEERRRTLDELIQEIRRLKKGAFAPISEQPFVRAILYPSGGLGLLAVVLRLSEGS